MANFPPLYLTAAGLLERLDGPVDGLAIDIIDSTTANSAVSLFHTVVTGGGGSVTLFDAFAGTINFGKVGGTTALLGGLTVAQNSVFTGNVTINGSATTIGNAPADRVTVTAQINSDVEFVSGGGAHAISIRNEDLYVYTQDSHDLYLTGADNVNISATAAAVTITAGTTGAFSSVGDLTLTAGAASNLTFEALTGNVAFNEASSTGLSFLFTATSIVGGLNEVRDAVHIAARSNYTNEAITLGDLVCLVYDATPGHTRAELKKCDNETPGLDRPVGIAVETKNVNQLCRYTMAGEAIVNTALVAHTEGQYLFMDGGVDAGKVSLVPPLTGTVIIVGTHLEAGIAGVARMIYQPMAPLTW